LIGLILTMIWHCKAYTIIGTALRGLVSIRTPHSTFSHRSGYKAIRRPALTITTRAVYPSEKTDSPLMPKASAHKSSAQLDCSVQPRPICDPFPALFDTSPAQLRPMLNLSWALFNPFSGKFGPYGRKIRKRNGWQSRRRRTCERAEIVHAGDRQAD
jgi:hypothetical protein